MGGSSDSAAHLGRSVINTKGSHELMRDPSVQVNLHENLYIDDQADINPS